MQVFISHKSEDKQEAIKIKKHLERCFINVWLDKDSLKGGDRLSSAFISGIKGNTSLVLLSEGYIDSPWCRNEFMQAYNEKVMGKGELIPVVIGSGDEAKKIYEKAKANDFPELVATMDSTKYISYNLYNPEKSCAEIAEAVQRKNNIRMNPLTQKDINGQAIQIIDFEIDPGTPLEVFQNWSFNVYDFMDFNDDDSKPIKKEIPIAIHGKGPGWLYAFLTIPFANKNEVFVFNKPTNKYVCVYARQEKKDMLGKVLNG